MQAAPFDCQALQTVNLLDIEEPQHRTHLTLADRLIRLLIGKPWHLDAGYLVELARLFLHGHLFQQFLSAAVSTFCGWYAGLGRGPPGQTKQETQHASDAARCRLYRHVYSFFGKQIQITVVATEVPGKSKRTGVRFPAC